MNTVNQNTPNNLGLDNTLNNDVNDSTLNSTQTVGSLELLEERAKIIKDVVKSGEITISKNVRTKVINVPVELQETYLTIQINRGSDEDSAMLSGDYDDKEVIATFTESTTPNITLNGKPLTLDNAVEIILSRETAVVTKKTYAVEEVALTTYTDTHTHTLATELRREELHIEGEDLLGGQNS